MNSLRHPSATPVSAPLRLASGPLRTMAILSAVGPPVTGAAALEGSVHPAIPAILVCIALCMNVASRRAQRGDLSLVVPSIVVWMVLSTLAAMVPDPEQGLSIGLITLGIGTLVGVLHDRRHALRWTALASALWCLIVGLRSTLPVADVVMLLLFPVLFQVAIAQLAAGLLDRLGAALAHSESVRSQLELTNLDLQRQREEARRANEVKSTFLANMSHELRTPLNAIIGYSELVGEELEGPCAEDVARIERSGRHLLALVNDVLDMSKIEAGELHLSSERVELQPLLTGLHELVAPLAAGGRNTLEWPALSAQRGAVTGDAMRLRQVLLNLLGNALKFTEDGTVELAVADEPDEMVIRVVDTGPGIETDLLENLFEPFVQGATAGAKHKGTGLGLAISRRLVGGMGGTLSVTSELGRGSCFEVRLPRASGRRPAAPVAEPAGMAHHV